MSSSARQVRVLHFGAFDLDLNSGELRKYGTRIRLQEQPFQILALLLDQAGEVVTREELRQKLWPSDTFVDFNHGLNNAVNRLREVLGDSAETPKFIETIPRRGYRWIVPVETAHAGPKLLRSEIEDVPTPSPSLSTAAAAACPETAAARTDGRPNYSRKTVAVSATMILVLIVASLGALWVHTPGREARTESLVVLPLENVSGDAAQEYFVDGMTDVLITNLAELGSVRVISRTSAMHYKGSRKTLPEIAQELNVDAVVEGTVARAGNRVRINAQLIDARADRHLWAEVYDRDVHDIMALQAELASTITAQVANHVDPQRQSRLNTKQVNPEAYEAYLHGRYEATHGAFTSEGFSRARDYFNRTIQLDPGNADAILGLAETYIVGDPATSRMLAAKALELDSNLAEAHAIIASLKFAQDWDVPGADAEFRRAMELQPNSTPALEWRGLFLAQTGRLDEALQVLQRAESIDPLALDIQCDMGLVLYLARRYDEAERQLQRVLRQDPNMTIAHRHLMRIYARRGQIPQYIDQFIKARAWFDQSPEQTEAEVRLLRAAYTAGGVQAFWRTYLKLELQKGNLPALGLARLYAHLGEREQCIAILQKEYLARDLMLAVWIKTDQEFDNARSDPRFQALLKRMGLGT